MYKLLLCIRYLKTRYIALACIVSVMLGVATMIVVNSVMAGFSTEMRDRLHNFLSDIVIESRGTEGIPDADAQMERVRKAAGEYIAAMTPTIEIPGMMTFTDPWSGETFTQPVQIQGIDPAGKASVGPLHDYLDSFNPVIEEGKTVREPLRNPSDTVGWELTSAGMEHRRKNQERRRMYLREIQSLGNSLMPGRQPSSTATESPDFDGQPDSPQPGSAPAARQQPAVRHLRLNRLPIPRLLRRSSIPCSPRHLSSLLNSLPSSPLNHLPRHPRKLMTCRVTRLEATYFWRISSRRIRFVKSLWRPVFTSAKAWSVFRCGTRKRVGHAR
ncbi:MAG UNVERIFIED_CONTAM: hypothetical protein LVR18_12870 [Planctomycetaceae bacterium]|jgi:hypothetical protein